MERDRTRAEIAAAVFADDPRVEVRTGDWRELAGSAPFDLVVLDGGGQGKGTEPPLEPAGWLRLGAVVVLDDYAPMTSRQPVHEGQPDEARMYWLKHPQLRGAEVKVTPAAASIVATFVG